MTRWAKESLLDLTLSTFANVFLDCRDNKKWMSCPPLYMLAHSQIALTSNLQLTSIYTMPFRVTNPKWWWHSQCCLIKRLNQKTLFWASMDLFERRQKVNNWSQSTMNLIWWKGSLIANRNRYHFYRTLHFLEKKNIRWCFCRLEPFPSFSKYPPKPIIFSLNQFSFTSLFMKS